MARTLSMDELAAKRDEFTTQARELLDKAVASGKSYIEVTRSTIENEAQDLLGKVREAGGKQLEQVQKIEKDLAGRAEKLIGQYGPELEKRIPAAASAVQLAEQLVKSADERLQKLLGQAADAAWSIPVENYDELNAKDTVKACRTLNAEDLEVIREYEAAHKNRKTVLREIDQMLNG